MAVLGWVTALGALWIACAWGVAVVLGGVIVRSGSERRALVPAAPDPRHPIAAGLVPRQRAPRREPRVACARTGRAAGRGRG
ncbi:MAG: hypothetical protein L0I24_23585 [Pseudonocardia sp.]|nr:hypothetical protein [Pseudonocardia sp.]